MLLGSCGGSHPGPKLIDADGVRYTACGGALWFRNEGNFKDPDAIRYEVLFKDAQGRSHDLKNVDILIVTDLPEDTPACNNSPGIGKPKD